MGLPPGRFMGWGGSGDVLGGVMALRLPENRPRAGNHECCYDMDIN